MKQEFKHTFSFLKKLPDHYYANLQFAEFILLDRELLEIKLALEHKLNCYIMAYTPKISKKSLNHKYELCNLIHAAPLTGTEQMLIRQYESLCKNKVIFVAYEKPIRFIERVIKSV